MSIMEGLTRKVIRVPNVGGMALTKARILLEDAGFARVVILYRESYEPRDTVLEQTPARDQMVYAGLEATVWVARRGYLQFLPAIYGRVDVMGTHVVRDLCFLFEHMFDSVEAKLEGGERFFDPLAAPMEFVHWLAQWTAFAVDQDWPEAQQRALVQRAVDLYRLRGTKRGLILFLKLFTGYEPLIAENTWPFRGFRADVDARIGIDSVILPPMDLAHCFVVTMPVRFDAVSTEMVVRIHQIIAAEKPAHTNYYLRFEEQEGDAELREFFAIGVRSGIGIDAEIVQP